MEKLQIYLVNSEGALELIAPNFLRVELNYENITRKLNNSQT